MKEQESGDIPQQAAVTGQSTESDLTRPLLTIQVIELGDTDQAQDASAVFTRSTSSTCSTS